MIKILYVITKSNWGGAQRYVYDIATSLDKEMFDAVVACGGNGPLAIKLREAGIRVITIPLLQRDINIIKEFLSLFALIKIFNREQPDIIHLNSTKIGGLGAVAALAAKLLTKNYPPAGRAGKQKTVFTAHGWGFNEDRPYIARVIIYFLQWLSVLFCDRIIAVSRAVLNQGMYFPFSRSKLILIKNAIMPPNFLDKKSAKRELANLARLSKTIAEDNQFPRPPIDGRVWLGTIAELTKNKGLTYLVDAAHQLKIQIPPASPSEAEQVNSKFQILIIGGGEDEKKLRAQIAALGLESDVFLLGHIEDAPKYLKAFDIFILPSITEALAYVLIEAGWAGLPAVATRVGGLPEITENEKGGFLVPSKNPEKLAEAIKKLLDSGELRKKMGRKNRQIVSQKFSFEKMLRETIDIYNGL